MKNDDFENYYFEIEQLNSALEKDVSGNYELLDIIQRKLDRLAAKYHNEKQLGPDRYALYQVQALLHYRNGDNNNAIQWMDEAIKVRGESFEFAEQFLSHLGAPQFKPADKSSLEKLLIGVFGIFAFVIGRTIGLLGILVVGMILGVPSYLGWWLGNRKVNIPLSTIRIVSWLGLVTWVIPPLGLLSGTFVLSAGNHLRTEEKRIVIPLAVLTIILSLGSATYGILLNLAQSDVQQASILFMT